MSTSVVATTTPSPLADDAAGILVDGPDAAKAAGLRYVTDARPGIRRKRAGKHFSYLGLDGRPIRDAGELVRLKALRIPPAWTDVWICPTPRGHLQATGRDARGRKQYLYHAQWRAVRDETKFHRMVLFGETLPMIRNWIERDLARPELSREKVLATVVALLDRTHLRIGNEEYTRANGSFGLTTLRGEHVDVSGSTIAFSFRGKWGKEHVVGLSDRRIARIIRRCQDLPGEELFQYLNGDGLPHPIESDDVNAYLRDITGQHITAKDFRTWAGTVIAAHTLKELGPAQTQAQAAQNVAAAIEAVAKHLGNTPAIARKSYVHPGIIAAYRDGRLVPSPGLQAEREAAEARQGLRAEEAEVLSVLRGLMGQENASR